MGPEPSTPADVSPRNSTNPPPPRRRFAWLPLVLVIVVLGGLVWFAVARKQNDSGPTGAPRGRPAATVGVAKVEQRSFPVEFDALGTVTPIATAAVRAQVSGVLQQVLYSEGQLVRRGQLLAVLDPRPFENALMQASGQLQRDEAQLDNARVVERRYRQLLAQDSIAQQEVDAQAALVKQLEGTVNLDRAAQRSAKLNLEFSRITAPISGRIGLRSIDVGNLVGPSDANGLVTITQVDPIDVVFAVPQDTVPALRDALSAGGALSVTAFDRSRTTQLATGRFLALDNLVDTQTGTVRAKARFENGQTSLFPNQFVNVRLKLRTIENALAVPVAAVRNGADGPFVYVLNAEKRTVALRKVERGLTSQGSTQLLSGVKAGEQVITEGADRLSDGANVRLPGDRGKGGGQAGGHGGAQGGNPAGAKGGGKSARQEGDAGGGSTASGAAHSAANNAANGPAHPTATAGAGSEHRSGPGDGSNARGSRPERTGGERASASGG